MNLVEFLNVLATMYLSINIEIGLWLIFLLVLIILLILLIKFMKKGDYFFHEIELNINLGNIGSVKISPNFEVAQIAHKAWAELITRKAGLPLDPENDVINEIYNSWYQLFSEIRALIKQIPANHLKKKNTKKLVEVLVGSLNKGLRPHLTKWQSKFRRWYELELKNSNNNQKTPQEIQKQYPEYNELMRDLQEVNGKLVSYTEEIKKLIS